MKKLLVIVCLFTSLSVFSQTDSLRWEYKQDQKRKFGWYLVFTGMATTTLTTFTTDNQQMRGVGGVMTITGLIAIFDSRKEKKKSKNKNK